VIVGLEIPAVAVVAADMPAEADIGIVVAYIPAVAEVAGMPAGVNIGIAVVVADTPVAAGIAAAEPPPVHIAMDIALAHFEQKQQ